ETAACKVFCSEVGFRTIDHALQIMGGEGYMTENIVERLWRDSRINIIVEGANEVMHSFIFAYGAKQLGEYMLGIKEKPLAHPFAAARLASELFAGLRPSAPEITRLHPRLADLQHTLEQRVREFSHQVKLAFRDHGEALVSRQAVQYRLSMSAIWLHALACTLAKADRSLRNEAGGDQFDDEMAIVEHVFAIGGDEIDACLRALKTNSDDTMRSAASAARRMIDALPNGDFVLPEKTPDDDARGTGRIANHEDIPQFGSGSLALEKENE
ncbi:MAG: hypothetical protein MI757_10510, partial [Pirellulales bacterium]|nr:hypothetical protein [Pirellulales bacterium]